MLVETSGWRKDVKLNKNVMRVVVVMNGSFTDSRFQQRHQLLVASEVAVASDASLESCTSFLTG